MRSFRVLTFGCQMNEHDSEKMAGVLAAEGYKKASEGEEPSIILINTCSIREKAEQKFYSELGKLKKLKKENPNLVIAVSGCIAQQEGNNILKRAPHVDLIFGNQNIPELSGLLKSVSPGVAERPRALTEFPDGYEHQSIPAYREGQITAFVNIMYGCDNFCSYCVVPHVRGREKSRHPDDIIKEIEGLVERGCREVTLLGQNVNSYGKGLRGGRDFTGLLKLVDGTDGLKRIRFVTSHPKDLSDSLIDAMAGLPKVCESIHLPVQSASDGVLAAMNRRYTFASYMEKLTKLKAAMPDIYMTTDIIVGFPGETDEEFEQTYRALEEIRYDGIFAFKYSKRPNTAALKLKGHLPETIKEERLERVLKLQDAITEEKHAARVGMVEEVLVEGPDRTGAGGRLSGRSRGGRIVNFAGGDGLIGTVVSVLVTEGKKHSVMGELFAREDVPAS